MKKTFIPLLVALGCSMTVRAQQDSSTLDMGGLRLKRQFTQHISIKGEALEKMPFANLAEAINVWLYGTYSNASTLVYVVDGNIVPDVNAWSVYDIAEIVLVQSALTWTGGNSGYQQLVLITTRSRQAKGAGDKFSLTVAGALALVKNKYGPDTWDRSRVSNTNLYHQYYISGRYELEKLQMGVSVNWLRDVLPGVKSDTTHTDIPLQINRFRFNAWVQTTVGHKSSLYVNVNATPEKGSQKEWSIYHDTYRTSRYETDERIRQFIVNPYLQFNTDIAPGFSNHFSASYQSFRSHTNYSINSTFTSIGLPVAARTDVYDTVHNRILVIRDNISRMFHMQDWTIEPAVYLQYAYTWQKNSQLVTMGYFPSLSVTYSKLEGKGHLFTGAPSVAFSYRKMLSFGGGVSAFLPPSGTTLMKAAVFPFAHVSLDIIKIGNDNRPSSLLLYASFARNYSYSFTTGALRDLTISDPVGNPPTFTPASVITGAPVSLAQPGDLYTPHTVWATGLGFHSPGDRLVAGYYFEKREFAVPVSTPLAFGTGVLIVTRYPPLQAYGHHISLMRNPASGQVFQWQWGITANIIKVKGPFPPFPANHTLGDFYKHTSCAGGWINHFRYRRVFAGVDILYHISEYEVTNLYYANQYEETGVFELQHMYAGCKIRAGKTHEVEVYADSRGLWLSSASGVNDYRRYYGAGFKMVL